MNKQLATVRIVCRNCETSELVLFDPRAPTARLTCTTCGEPLDPPDPKAKTSAKPHGS